MITIDGSMGEGGGQIVRASLALSLVTGKAVVLEKIRAGRRTPGLRLQHLAAVRAAAAVGLADVTGDEVGSRRVVFTPGELTPGKYTFVIQSAGSATLVLETVLPALMIAAGPSELFLTGGTHNPWAPPFDFVARALIPLLNRMGARIAATLLRPGFYPAGGGEMRVRIEPAAQLAGFELLERGRLLGRSVRAVTSRLPRRIAERECARIAEKSAWPAACFQVEEVAQPRGPGNVVMIELESEHVTEVFTGFGQRGVSAEKVADTAFDAARAYLDAGAPVGPYLADQLLAPLAIAAHRNRAASAFRTTSLTEHSRTLRDVLGRFLDVQIDVTQTENGLTTVQVVPTKC